MTRVDELIEDMKLLINEHYALGLQIEENVRLRAEIEKAKEEIRQQQWYFGVEKVNQIIGIINKHVNHESHPKMIKGEK